MTVETENQSPETETAQSEELCWVLVEAVATYRMQYMVQVPVSNPEWALDTVTMEKAEEFGQKYLGETIFNHRVVQEDEAIALFDKGSSYAQSWSKELKMKNAFTPYKK